MGPKLKENVAIAVNTSIKATRIQNYVNFAPKLIARSAEIRRGSFRRARPGKVGIFARFAIESFTSKKYSRITEKIY